MRLGSIRARIFRRALDRERVRWIPSPTALATLVALLSGAPRTEAGQEDDKVLVLAQPLARADAFWMAQSKSFFGEQQLKVSVRWAAGGADALRVFREGREGRRGFGDFIVASEVTAVDF